MIPRPRRSRSSTSTGPGTGTGFRGTAPRRGTVHGPAPVGPQDGGAARPDPLHLADLGWRARHGGRAAWASPGRTYTATTTQAAGLYPFLAGSGSPTAGVPLGQHLLWGEVVCCDPLSWLDAGLTSNPGMFLLGQPGVGKSAFAKRQIVGLAAFGVRPIVVGDTKGEHTPVIEALGGQVVRVGRGLDRINPLDAGPLGRAMDRLPAHLAAAYALEVRGRRLASLLALCSLVRGSTGRPVSNVEEMVLGRAVDLAGAPGAPDPTVAQVAALIRTGPKALLDAVDAVDEADYRASVRDLLATLGLLLEGTLKGVFDGPTTRPLDLEAPGISIDISRSAATGDTVASAAMLATWAWAFGAVDAGHALAAAGLAPRRRHLMVMDELWRALRGAAGLVEHADALTRLNRAKGIASLMITHSMADLEALPTAQDVATARGFVERSAITVLGGLPPRELDAVGQVVPLTHAEKAMVASWSSTATWAGSAQHPGRGRYLIKTGQRPGLPLLLTLTAAEAALYDTDALIRREHAHP
jgi:hypothetical protein